MTDNGYIQIYRDAFTDPTLNSLPVADRWVYLSIIAHCCHSACTQNDHGRLIKLEPGQLLCTIRHLAELTYLKKKVVENSLKRLIENGKLGQTLGHRKSIFTISWGIKFNNDGTNFGTKLGHKRITQDKANDDDDDAEKKFEEVDMKTRITKQDANGFDVLCSLDDYFEYAVRKNKPWSTEEIQSAWAVLFDHPGRITHWKLFMDGIIKKEREKKQKKPKEKKCELQTSTTESEKSKDYYSEDDTKETPLARFERVKLRNRKS